MSNTQQNDFTEAAVKAALEALAFEKARQAAEKLKAKQKRQAESAARKADAQAQTAARCVDIGFVRPDGIEDKTAPTLDLCYRILECQPWGFAFNELAQQYEFRGDVHWPAHYGRVLNDPLVLAIRLNLIEVFGIEFSNAQVEESLKALCFSKPFHPVVDYLDSLEWDGVKRIDTWLTTYLSAPDNEYTRAVGGLWLKAGVARAKHPGIKFDNVIIFEGEQGSEKSGAFKVLGGEYHSDADLGDVKNKDAAIQLQGVWIQELPELGAMRRSDLNDLKAFFSRDQDKFRAPHARVAQTYLRRCVCGATGNTGKDRGYLTDDTGNRRYWPVKTGAVDYNKLRMDRDQLWAEAAHSWKESIRDLDPRDYRRAIELPKALWAIAGEEQRARLLVDPWVELLKPWLDDPFHERGQSHTGYDGRTYGEILAPYLSEGNLMKVHSRILMAECLGISPGSQNREHGRRLRTAMAAIGGWDYTEQLSAGRMKGIGGYTKAEGGVAEG